MQSYFLDANGKLRWPDDAFFAPRTGGMARDASLVDEVIEARGWIEVHQNKGHFRVKCRPAMVSRVTLATLYFILNEQPTLTIALEFLADRWHHLILCNRMQFVHFLSSLTYGDATALAWGGPRLLNREYPAAASRFSDRVRMARVEAQCARKTDDLSSVYDQLFNGRWSLWQVDLDVGDSVSVALGRQYTPFNPQWSAKRGQSIHRYADEDYGNWISELHRSVCTTGIGVFDDVDAVVSFPQLGDTRLRYSRMTLPVDLGDGGRLVLSAAETNNTVDLRQPPRRVADLSAVV